MIRPSRTAALIPKVNPLSFGGSIDSTGAGAANGGSDASARAAGMTGLRKTAKSARIIGLILALVAGGVAAYLASAENKKAPSLKFKRDYPPYIWTESG